MDKPCTLCSIGQSLNKVWTKSGQSLDFMSPSARVFYVAEKPAPKRLQMSENNLPELALLNLKFPVRHLGETLNILCLFSIPWFRIFSFFPPLSIAALSVLVAFPAIALVLNSPGSQQPNQWLGRNCDSDWPDTLLSSMFRLR